MITNILVVRKFIRRFLQKYQTPVELLGKFLLSYVAFSQIVDTLDYSALLQKSVVKLGVGLLGAIVPGIVTIMVFCVAALYEVYSEAPILSALVLVLFIIIFCFAARFSGKQAYAIIAIPLLMKYNLHYMIPLLLGLTGGPLAIFPAACGVMFYSIFKVIVADISIANYNSMDEALALYLKVINDMLADKDIVVTIAAFAAAIIVMWLMRRLQYSFAFELTIIGGACTCLIVYFLAYLKLGSPIHGVLSGTLLSVLIVSIIQFFRLILDYTGVETVQFEDDDYYYYVKAVPKIDTEVPDSFKELFAKKSDRFLKHIEDIEDVEPENVKVIKTKTEKAKAVKAEKVEKVDWSEDEIKPVLKPIEEEDDYKPEPIKLPEDEDLFDDEEDEDKKPAFSGFPDEEEDDWGGLDGLEEVKPEKEEE